MEEMEEMEQVDRTSTLTFNVKLSINSMWYLVFGRVAGTQFDKTSQPICCTDPTEAENLPIEDYWFCAAASLLRCCPLFKDLMNLLPPLFFKSLFFDLFSST
jgi:hypothetical protein